VKPSYQQKLEHIDFFVGHNDEAEYVTRESARFMLPMNNKSELSAHVTAARLVWKPTTEHTDRPKATVLPQPGSYGGPYNICRASF
jgi:hypothetical protein